MQRQLIVHIGLPKTGTTALQHFCFANRHALLAQGLLYPRTGMGWQRHHAPLVASCMPHRPLDHTMALRRTPWPDVLRALRAEIAASGAPRTLLSCEHFSTWFGPRHVERLREDFADFELRAVLTVRHHMSLFLASYATQVTAGGALDLEDYAASVLSAHSHAISAAAVVRAWQAGLGPDQVEIVDYDAEGDVVTAILARAGIANIVGAGGAPRRRPSLGPHLIRALRHANADLLTRAGGRQEDRMAWLRHSGFSILCRRHLAAATRGMPAGRWFVPKEAADRVVAIAAADRAWLAAHVDMAFASAPPAAGDIVIGPVPDEIAETEVALGREAARRVTRGLWGASSAVVKAFGRA